MLVERLSFFSLKLSDALILVLSITALWLSDVLVERLSFFSLRLSDALILALSITAL